MEESERSEHSVKEEVKKKEETVKVSCSTATNYIFASKTNYFLFPITILFFFCAEGLNTVFFRFLAGYEDLTNGQHDIFAGDDDLYWTWMGVIQVAFFIFLIIKYFLMHLVILNSNEQIHDEMIYGLIRSSSTYFDITPTGQLTNKFSNDMGILDNNMPLTLIETIEGPIVALVLFANVFAIDLFFLIPGVINLIVVVVYFLYCKDAIVASKQLYLRLKSPVYGMISEMISSLTQIRIFNRRMSLMKDFSRLIDKLFAGDMGFWLLSRAFGAYISYITIIVMIIAYIIGIRNVEASLEDPNTTTSAATLAGLYGVSVVFLIQVNDSIQVFLRQMIFLESVFVSVERTFLIKNL